MKLLNKFIIIYRGFIKRIFVTIMLICVCLITFYMSDRTWNSYLKTACELRHERNGYGQSAYNINKIVFSTESSYEEEKKMLQDLSEIPEISAYGMMSKANTVDLAGYESIDVIVCDINLTDMCNVGVTQEEVYKMYGDWNGLEPVLLGSSFKGHVSVGDRFTIFSSECVVAGFLKDDAQWLINENQSIEEYSLKETGVLLTKDFSRYNLGESLEYTMPIYYIADYSDKDIITEKILSYQEEHIIRASVSNEGERLKENEENNTITADKTFVATLLLYIISIVAVSAVTIIECLLSRRDYGLFIINGMSRKTVYSIIVIKNIIITMISAVLAWIYCQWKTFGGFIPKMTNYMIETQFMALIKSHCVYVPTIIITEAVLITLISCAIPIIYLHKRNLVELMKK